VFYVLRECAVVQEEIYSSSYAAAAYLESIDFKKKVRGCTTRKQSVLHGW
jgi:hypothetical protein